MTRVALMLFFAAIEAQAQLSCTRLATIYDSACPDMDGRRGPASVQGRPGKMGAAGVKGERGEKGLPGPRGPTAEMNYSRVEDMISRSVAEVLDSQSVKFMEVSSKLEEAKAEINRLKNVSGFCPINYHGKCFWIQLRSPYVTCEQARAVCAEQGGALANVYSERHYYLLKEYWTLFAPLNIRSEIHAFIGLTYDHRDKSVSLSDGRPAPFVKWYPGYPRYNGECMAITTRMSRSSVYNHMHDSPIRGTVKRGLICEK